MCAASKRGLSALGAEQTLPPHCLTPSCSVLSLRPLSWKHSPPLIYIHQIFPSILTFWLWPALTSNFPCVHHSKAWMSCTCWMCHWCYPGTDPLPGRHGVRFYSKPRLTTQKFMCSDPIRVSFTHMSSFCHMLCSLRAKSLNRIIRIS